MGLSSSKSKTKNSGETTETVTRTRTNPEFVEQPIKNSLGRIDALAATDPYRFVAGPSELQQQAWQGASGLGSWQEALEAAVSRANGIGGTNVAAGASYRAPQLGSAPQGAAVAYDAALAGSPSLASPTGYAAPQLGRASHAAAYGYDPVSIDPEQIAALREAAGRRGSEFYREYLNPYLDEVVGATKADLDENAARVRAQQAAQASLNKAQSGSRYALREALTDGELHRATGSVLGNLRLGSFDRAMSLGQQDADRLTNVDMFNSGQANSRSNLQAQLNQQGKIYSADAKRAAAEFLAGARNRAAELNAGFDNSFKTAQASLDAGAAEFAASAFNAADQFNRNSEHAFRLADQQAVNMGRAAKAAAGNNFGLANLEAIRDYAKTQAGLEADEGRFNAGNAIDVAKFNANQADTASARELQLANLLADLASSGANNMRADLNLQAALGDQQRQVAQQYAQAPLTLEQLIAQMYGGLPLNLFGGENSSSRGTSKGTSVTKNTPSAFNQALAAAQAVAAFTPSDRRLKRDIEAVGRLQNGVGLYRYRYRWDEDDRQARIGVMADEVARIRPDALGPSQNGYQTVDYGRLGLAHLVEG